MAKRTTRLRQVSVSELAKEAIGGAPDAPDLHPSDLENMDPPIVEKVDDHFQIVDGFHRISGVASYLLGEKESLNTRIEVVDATGYDEDVISAAAVPEGYGDMTQEEAIQELLDAARGGTR